MNGELFETGRTCVFSECRTWRYILEDRWDDGPALMFVGLNPSTADEHVNDNTVSRCINWAKLWKYPALVMANAYGYRATNPKDMKRATDPVGPEYDQVMPEWFAGAGKIIVAWGNNITDSRQKAVLKKIKRPVECLKITAQGKPWHPLYVRTEIKPIPFKVPK